MISQPIFLVIAEITKWRGGKNRKEGNDGNVANWRRWLARKIRRSCVPFLSGEKPVCDAKEWGPQVIAMTIVWANCCGYGLFGSLTYHITSKFGEKSKYQSSETSNYQHSFDEKQVQKMRPGRRITSHCYDHPLSQLLWIWVPWFLDVWNYIKIWKNDW